MKSREENNAKWRDRGKGVLLHPPGFLPPSLFSCSRFFEPSSLSGRLEQATIVQLNPSVNAIVLSPE